MLYIVAVFTLALKLLMLAQPSGDASPDFYDFGHDVAHLFQGDPIDFYCPLRGSLTPRYSLVLLHYFIDFADETLEFPPSRPVPVPTRSSLLQSFVNVDVDADHIPAPTSTRKYIPADIPLPLESSNISWVLIVSLVVIGIAFGLIISGALLCTTNTTSSTRICLSSGFAFRKCMERSGRFFKNLWGFDFVSQGLEEMTASSPLIVRVKSIERQY
ncbi:hypothetical protein ACEPAG_4648 [Sanghuangporus baumii]